MWQAADDKRVREPRTAPKVPHEGDSSNQGSSSAREGRFGTSMTPVNFAGALDSLDGSTRVDMLGVPLSDQYEMNDGAEASRSTQGKVGLRIDMFLDVNRL